MNLNIILDNDVVLDLLSMSTNDTQHCFTRLQKSPTRFWLSCLSLSSLKTQIFSNQHHPLKTLLDNIQLLSTLATHWKEIPEEHPNKIQAAISLDAATLPGKTIIWTNEADFATLHPDIECGDHQFVYAMLAEFECEVEESMPFCDLENQQLVLRSEIEKSFFNILKHGQYILGPEVQTLESELTKYTSAAACITVGSGAEAILLALMALDIKAGDEIITTPFASTMHVEMIILMGARPVFVDIDPDTYLLNVDLLEVSVTTRTKAIMPVNLYGQCADYEEINIIAKKHNLFVIEEATQSFGAKYQGIYSGNLGAIGCISFLPCRTLGSYGNAGACLTNDLELAEKLRNLQVHEHIQDNCQKFIGLNSGLDTIQAGFLLAKLKVFPQELEKRIQVGETYTKLLQAFIKTPVISANNRSVYTQYTIQVRHREKVLQTLKSNYIPTSIYYPIPIHLQPTYASLEYEENTFPVAEEAAKQVLSLPIHAYLEENVIQRIVKTLKQAMLY